MHNNYILLVESIFGFGNQAMYGDWGLKTISRNFHARESDALYSFLHPNGPLFQLIRHLMTDPLANRFEFPKALLPVSKLKYSMCKTKFINSKNEIPETNKMVT